MFHFYITHGITIRDEIHCNVGHDMITAIPSRRRSSNVIVFRNNITLCCRCVHTIIVPRAMVELFL